MGIHASACGVAATIRIAIFRKKASADSLEASRRARRTRAPREGTHYIGVIKIDARSHNSTASTAAASAVRRMAPKLPGSRWIGHDQQGGIAERQVIQGMVSGLERQPATHPDSSRKRHFFKDRAFNGHDFSAGLLELTRGQLGSGQKRFRLIAGRQSQVDLIPPLHEHQAVMLALAFYRRVTLRCI